MRAAGRHIARDPFQIAAQLFELNAWTVVIGLGACLHYHVKRATCASANRLPPQTRLQSSLASLAHLV